MWADWNVLGFAEGLWRSSLVDNTAMHEKLRSVTEGRKWKRAIALQAVDLNNAEIVIFDETTPQEQIPDAITASASIPIIFPPVTIDKK
jgi:predicted acylesterase/phospholipase RssA